MRDRLAYALCIVLIVATEGGKTGFSRRLQDENATNATVRYVLAPKVEYPIDPAAMIIGSFVGALGVPFLFALWACLEKRKPGGGAFGALEETE
eukprot:Skav233146  [mRNA]  locus=scaffold1669:124634:128959:+ [translate_table: standard]